MVEALTVGILGFGEVGSLLYDGITANGHVVTVWDNQFECHSSAAACHLRDRPGIQVASSAIDLARRCEVLISAVTAGNAVEALKSCLPGLANQCFYVDLNSVSSRTKARMAELAAANGARFIEAAVLSPIRPGGLSSPILTGGASAGDFLTISRALGFSGLSVASVEIGRASAIKMCRSVMIKGMEALVTESLVAAHHFGVVNEVLGSLSNLLPREDWQEFAEYLIRRSIQHGVRRSEELLEAAETVAEAGLDPLMTNACADRQTANARFVNALGMGDLSALLDAVSAQVRFHSKRELQ